jgi:protoporphyrinogen oxidase
LKAVHFGPDGDLLGYATKTYGSAIAERFLLNYSEKLWGIGADRLSSGMANMRLKGLSIQALLAEALRATRSRTDHPDGSFYYPDRGIQAIADALGEAVGGRSILKGSRVTRIVHDGSRIGSIVLNGASRVEVGDVISTIPLPEFLEIMEPAPPEAVMAPARRLRYRDLILVALLLGKDSVTPNATVYFPEKDFIFTRAYEPKNRGRHMAPPGHTSLVFEVPCDPGDTCWDMADRQLVDLVLSQIAATAWVKPDDIMGTEVRRMEHAYPVIDLDSAGVTEQIMGFLGNFTNLRISGRNGRFVYCSIHDLAKESREIAEAYSVGSAPPLRPAGLSPGRPLLSHTL